MMKKSAIRGNSERSYFQVGFRSAKVLWTGMVDGHKHVPLIPKVASSNPAAGSYFCFKPISNLNHSELMPNLKNSELMPKLNLKHLKFDVWNNFECLTFEKHG
jgi:hypothetical protein